MANEALGMIETYGYIGAVEAADVCVKSANVKLLGIDFVRGGLVTIHITGDVGAVKASIDAAESAVKKFNCLVSSHVIPRPGEGIEKILPKPTPPDDDHDEDKKKEDEKEDKEVEEEAQEVEEEASEDTGKVQDESEPESNQVSEEEVVESDSQEEKKDKNNQEKPKIRVNINSREELKKIKTVKLRAIARELDDQFSEYLPIERNQIKYSKKNELINAILKFYERVK